MVVCETTRHNSLAAYHRYCMYKHTHMGVAGGRLLSSLLTLTTGWLGGRTSMGPLFRLNRRLTLLQCTFRACRYVLVAVLLQASNGVRGTVARLTNNDSVGGRVCVHASLWCACVCYGMVAVEWDGSH